MSGKPEGRTQCSSVQGEEAKVLEKGSLLAWELILQHDLLYGHQVWAEKFKERCPWGSCSRRNPLEFVFWALSEVFTFVATRSAFSLPILWLGRALSGGQLAKLNVKFWHTLWQGPMTCPTWHSPAWLPHHSSSEHLYLSPDGQIILCRT